MQLERQILLGPDFSAVVENGRLTEFIRTAARDQSGDILLGKVDRLMPGLDCAFVDIGRDRAGFLPLREDSRSFSAPPLRSGETLLLQIKKEERDKKGAFLTRDIVLPGETVILMPCNRYVGVSGRVGDPEQKDRLRRLGSAVTGGRFGLILRLAALEAPQNHAGDHNGGEVAVREDAVREESERLFSLWQELSQKAASGGPPGACLLHGSEADQLLADYRPRGIAGIQRVESLSPRLLRQLRQADQRRVPLPGGGNIVIDPCEALTAVDVNSAAASGTEKRQTVLETNLEACDSIAEQIRLRNLSGILLIDFIDMDSEADRALVLERLSEAFSRDRIKTVLHGWTALGLLEMTRKRRGLTLSQQETKIIQKTTIIPGTKNDQKEAKP